MEKDDMCWVFMWKKHAEFFKIRDRFGIAAIPSSEIYDTDASMPDLLLKINIVENRKINIVPYRQSLR